MTPKTQSVILEFLQNHYSSDNTLTEETVKIPVEKGELGHSLDDPLESYKRDIEGGKPWDKMSKELNTLAIFNKNNHPEIAEKARSKREALARWVEEKRKNNPKFGD